MAEKGLFIVIEGIDGCGKNTQAHRLVSWLYAHYKEELDLIVLTREPTLSKYGKEIYERLHSKSEKATPERMLELYLQDREQHVDDIIAPMLQKKAIVICDRYKYSTIAYQSAQGLLTSKVIDDNAGFPVPDLVVLLNLTPEEAIARMEKSGKKMDSFEKKNFLERVHKKYIQLPSLLPAEKITLINANQSVEKVSDDVAHAVKVIVEHWLK